MTEVFNRVMEQAAGCLLPNAASPNPLLAACKGILQDLEKKSDHIMLMINELPFADYKGYLTAPHTLLDVHQSLDLGEYKNYSEFLSALDHVWDNVQMYYPAHTPAHKAAADMKELGVKHVSEISGIAASQLCSQAQAAASQAAAPASAMNAAVSLQDIPSLAQMTALGSADFAHSIFQSLLSPNSFQFNPADPSIFSYLMSQPDMSMISSAAAAPASAGENALNIVHGIGGYDPSVLNQYFNQNLSLMYPQMQPAAEAVGEVFARATPHVAAKKTFTIEDLGPEPQGINPLLDPEPSVRVPLDMVGITATVHFKCQFNIDALRNYADKNEKRFVPSSDQKKSVENSVNFRISVPNAPHIAQVAGVLFVNGICKVSFARSDLSDLFDEVQRHVTSIDADAQLSGHRVIQEAAKEWVTQEEPKSEWRRWGSISYCLIKKQFQVGFKVMYSIALEMLRPLEKEGFIYDLRPAQSSGSGLFFRLRLRAKQDPLEGEISATVYHSGMVQVNGSKGCTEEHLQTACNGFFQYLQRQRAVIMPPTEELADGNKRKKRAVACADALYSSTPTSVAAHNP